jgi:hypothetical protein
VRCKRAVSSMVLATLWASCDAQIRLPRTLIGDLSPVPIESPSPSVPKPTPPRLRRHSSSELMALLDSLSAPGTLRLSAEQLVRGFDNDAQALEVHDRFLNEWLALAEGAASAAVQQAACTTETCAHAALERWALIAWSRPLTADERSDLWALAQNERIEDRLRIATLALLASPSALYRVEHRNGQPALSALESAQALAFFLTGAPPPAWLLDEAADGTLATGAGRRAAADRLLSTPSSERHVIRLLKHWLMVDQVTHLNKNPDLLEVFSRVTREALDREVDAALRQLVFEAPVTLGELFTAPHSWPGAAAAPFNKGPARRGLLLLPAVLARHASTDNSGPVTRGLFIRERVLCTPLQGPPPSLAAQVMAPLPAAPTTRASFEQHSADERCAGCHRLIDPPGFAFENYDLLGRYRADENGHPVDTTGSLEGTDVDGAFTTADALLDRLASSAQVRQCLNAHLASYAFGREVHRDEVPVPPATATVREALLQLVEWQGFVQPMEAP